MKTTPERPFTFTIDTERVGSLRIIRQREADAPDRAGFISPDYDCLVLSHQGTFAGMAQLLIRGDLDGALQVGPMANTVDGETVLNFPHEDGVGFERGKAWAIAPGLRVDMSNRSRDQVDFAVDTEHPLVIVRTDTFREVVRGAQRSNGKNFAYPKLVDLFRGLRGLHGYGPQAGLWHVGLGRAIETADLTDRALELRMQGRPAQGYKASHIGNGMTVDRRASRR